MRSRKKNVLITGAVSLYGKSIIEILKRDYNLILIYHLIKPDYKLTNGTKYFQLDITQPKKVNEVIDISSPDIIIHLVGLSNIDYCEKNPRLAYQVNVSGTANIMSSIKNKKTHLIFISSNAIFDGTSPPYKETDKPNPLNIYGKTKLAAEAIILKKNILTTIIRCTTIFGWPPIGARENDLSFYLKQLKKNQPLYLVNDLFFNPVSAFRASEAVKAIIVKKSRGIFHVAGKDRISRYTFVESIINAFQIKRHPPLIPVTHDFFPQLAPRPVNACLAINKMQQLINVFPLSLLSELKLLKKEQSFKSTLTH